jgi:hypothetical protein
MVDWLIVDIPTLNSGPSQAKKKLLFIAQYYCSIKIKTTATKAIFWSIFRITDDEWPPSTNFQTSENSPGILQLINQLEAAVDNLLQR